MSSVPHQSRLELSRDGGRSIRVRWPRATAFLELIPVVLALATPAAPLLGDPSLARSLGTAAGVAFLLWLMLAGHVSIAALDRAARAHTAHPKLRQRVSVPDLGVGGAGYRASATFGSTVVQVDGRSHALSDACVVIAHWERWPNHMYGVQLAFPDIAYELDTFTSAPDARALAKDVAEMLELAEPARMIEHRPFATSLDLSEVGDGGHWRVAYARLGGFSYALLWLWTVAAAAMFFVTMGSQALVVTVVASIVPLLAIPRFAAGLFRSRAEARAADMLRLVRENVALGGRRRRWVPRLRGSSSAASAPAQPVSPNGPRVTASDEAVRVGGDEDHDHDDADTESEAAAPPRRVGR